MAARTRTKYEADDGTIHPITMTPDFAAAAGTSPAGAVNSDIKVKISKGNQEYGIRPRGVTLSRVAGTAPDTFTKTTFLPVLTPTAYDSAAFATNASVTVGGVAWTVVSKRPEDY